MRIIITLSAVIVSITSVYAQKIKEADVPPSVKEEFKKQFPDVKKAEWEKEDANYEAEFKVSRVAMDNSNAKKEEIEKSVVFSASGELLETEEEIKVSALPTSVSEYVSKNYAGYKLEEAAKITDNKGAVTYEAEIEKGKEELDLLFDATGAFIKKETEKPDEKDKKKD
jgi:hypothetical protein